MVGIVVALKKEAEETINKIKDRKELNVIGKKLFIGKIAEKDVVLILSGVGKVNAAISTQFLFDNYPIDYIINFGSVGGLARKAEVLSYYNVEKCCQYDFDVSAIDNVSVGYIQDFDTVYFYTKKDFIPFLPKISLASSDKITEKESDIKIVSDLGCAIFDMELGAIGQVCYANNKPFISFKGVTDIHGSGIDGNTYYKNSIKVCSGFYEILYKILSK